MDQRSSGRRPPTMTSRPESKNRRVLWVLRALWSWDLWISSVVACIAFFVLYFSNAPLVDINTFAAPVVPFGIVVAGFNWAAQRAVIDRTKDSPLGRLVRWFDRSEMQLSLPYIIGIAVGVATSLSGIVGLLVRYSLTRLGHSVFFSTLLFFVLYSLLVTVSLVIVSFRHQRRYSLVQADKEELDRVQRELELSGNNNGQG